MDKEKQDKVVTLRNELSKIEKDLGNVSVLKETNRSSKEIDNPLGEIVYDASFAIGERYAKFPIYFSFCEKEMLSILDHIENILSEKANRLREELDNL